MPTPKKGPRLGGSPSHQRLILSNLATALFEHGRITTTETRARTLRPVAEKLITKAKKAELGTVESLHNRREVLKTVRDKSVVHTLFTEIGPSFAERPGGYTRILRVGFRRGDAAEVAHVELVGSEYNPNKASEAEAKEAPKKTKGVGDRIKQAAQRMRPSKGEGGSKAQAGGQTRGKAQKSTTPRKAGGS